MAGGDGKRLWPSSRRFYPKPLFSLQGRDSLLRGAVGLFSSLDFLSEITVLAGAPHEKALRSHLGPVKAHISTEPLSRNTAPAITLGVMSVLREFEEEDEDAIFVVSPSDHLIGNKKQLSHALKTAIAAAEKGLIITIGATPTRPETGYGYIEKGVDTDDGSGKVFKIKQFVEKPNLQTARKYVKDSFLWNCGIFVFKGRVMMEEMKKHAPKVFSSVRKALSKENSFGVTDAESYARSPNISIDCAVMEKTDLGAVIPASFGWNDVGSWESVYNLSEKDSSGNALSGDVVIQESENCLVRGDGRLVVVHGLKDVAIVSEQDALFVSDIKSSGEIKSVVDTLISEKRPEALRPFSSRHGWGSEETIEKGCGFSVKSVTVEKKMEYEPDPPAGRLIVLEGEATATLANKSVVLSEGDLLEIPEDVPLRVKNGGKSVLRLLEISFGTNE